MLSGHTPSEQYLFLVTSIWFACPMIIASYPALFGWRLRPGAARLWGPTFAAFGNIPTSILHWAAYKPRSWRQLVDVAFAGSIVARTLYESWLLASGRGPFRGEAPPAADASRILGAFVLLTVVLTELDIFHQVHSRGYTTHVTGTLLHWFLRLDGFLFSSFLTGEVAFAQSGAPALLAYAGYALLTTGLHGVWARAVASQLQVDARGARGEPLAPIECALGLFASCAFPAAHLAGLWLLGRSLA